MTDKPERVAVIGLGYVGLPLAVAFCQNGFGVTGIDLDHQRLGQLEKGKSYIQDVSSETIADCLKSGRFRVSSEYQALSQAEAIIVCVPTPLRKTKDPDMSYVVDAAERISPHLRRGQLVILESTVYPGATEELIQPLLERPDLAAGREFHLAFSPERVDPGNRQFSLRQIPKVIGGLTPACAERAQQLYEAIFDRVLTVGSLKEAELTKLLENTFRSVNIGLINELALMAHKMGINIWSVIEAAATKPFGFMPFYPGPGLGGHCIPLDPFYLSWKAKSYGADARFIELAGEVNGKMPAYVVTRIMELLNQKGKLLRGAKLLILGVAYKRDINDLRESPALDIIDLLEERGAQVSYHDPHVPEFAHRGRERRSAELSEKLLARQDCVVIVTAHSAFDYGYIAEHTPLIFDTRNATQGLAGRFANIEVL
ncbi:MAG TPA: nucleotide sugar dehydrogenase [Candidatus Fraserbacteria bacterium]|nr:nucleotide sugar dehydrogenase [Candidatus Fraserbacteria bacterium]